MRKGHAGGTMTKKVVNIMGAMGWPYWKDGECWGLNNCGPATREGWDELPITAWFQMHPRAHWSAGRNGAHEWMMLKRGFPIYMQEAHDDIPDSVAYPLKVAKGLWPKSMGEPVLADTFCYMIALAILKGYKEVRLLGALMAAPVEAWAEVPGLAMWITLGATKGIKLSEAPERILAPFLYGYERRVPSPWMPENVAAELIVDENLDARTQRSLYRMSRDAWLSPPTHSPKDESIFDVANARIADVDEE